MMTVKTEAGMRRIIAELKKEFAGDSSAYARGYKAALREVAQALTGDPRSAIVSDPQASPEDQRKWMLENPIK